MRMVQYDSLKQIITVDGLLYACLFLVFFLMPSETSPPVLFAGAALAIWLFSGRCIYSFRNLLKWSWLWPVLFVVAITWIGMLYSPGAGEYGLRYAKKTHYYLYSLIVASIAFRQFPVQRLFQAFLWGLAINAVVGVFQAVGLAPAPQNQFTGFGLGYRTLSAYLVVGMLYAAFRFGNNSGKKTKIQYAVFIVLFFIHITLMRSRTGYYTLIVLSPVMMHFAFRKLSVWKNVGICLLAVCLMFLSPVVRARMQLTMKQLQHHINADPEKAWGRVYTKEQNRFYMWYGAARIILENPVFGVGTGGYPVVLHEMGDPKWPIMRHPHNDLLYMTVSFGIVGLFAYVWFFFEIIKNTWPHRHSALGNFIFSTILVVMISGCTNAQILDAGMILLLSLVVGLQNALPQFERKEPRICGR